MRRGFFVAPSNNKTKTTNEYSRLENYMEFSTYSSCFFVVISSSFYIIYIFGKEIEYNRITTINSKYVAIVVEQVHTIYI